MANKNHQDPRALEQLSFFNEFHPNPIIGLSLSFEIVYLNLSARIQFPSLSTEGTKHPILFKLIEEMKQLHPTGKDLIVYSQDVKYLDSVYEQQIFLIPHKDVIFIFMTDVTAKEKQKAKQSELV